MEPAELNFPTIPLRYRGRMDIEAIYHATAAWCEGERLLWSQLFYKDKVSGPGMTEKEIKFSGKLKMDEFQDWQVRIELKFWDCKPEVVNGKTLFTGRCELQVSSYIRIDYDDNYEKSRWLRRVRKMLMDALHRENDEVLKKECIGKCYELQNEWKKILGSESAV